MKATRPRHGRRTNLEPRRLLGVEAQDAGLRRRAPPAARRARRALALLQGAAARPSRRRGPLRRVGLISGHPVVRALLPATSYAIGERYFSLLLMLLARAPVSYACSTRPMSRGDEGKWQWRPAR